jgi:hypothetical protein
MRYTVEMASDGMIYIPSLEDWYRRSSNIKVLSQQFECL